MSINLFWALPAMAAPGDHIPLGGAVLTPSLTVGVEHTTNAYHVEEVGADSGATNLKVAPELDLRLTKPEHDFRLHGVYELRKYFAAKDVPLDRYDDFSIRADVDAFDKSVVGLRAHEGLGLQNFPVDSDAPTQSYTSQLRNQTTLALVVRPTSPLEFTAGGRYAFDDYRTAALAGSSDDLRLFNTRHTFGPTASAAWKFIPRTAVVVDFSYDHAVYAVPAIDVVDGANLYFPTHDVVRVAGGLRGRLTERIVITMMAGFGSAVYDETSVPDAPATAAVDLTGIEQLLVDTSVRYELAENGGIVVGVTKDFRDSFFTNYVSYLKGYVSADARLTELVGVGGELSATSENFRGQVTRDDLLLAAKGDVSFYVQNWASIAAGTTLEQRSSSDATVDYGAVSVRLMFNAVY